MKVFRIVLVLAAVYVCLHSCTDKVSKREKPVLKENVSPSEVEIQSSQKDAQQKNTIKKKDETFPNRATQKKKKNTNKASLDTLKPKSA